MRFSVFISSLVLTWVANCSAEDTKVNSGKLLTVKPKWLMLCKKTDPKLNDCMLDLFKTMFPELAGGIPEINIDHFEPLHINRVSVTKGTGPVTLAGSLFNMTVRGPSKAVPTYTRMDLKKKTFDFGIDMPLLDIRSQYNLKGKILVLPLVGHGAAELRLTKVSTKVSTKLKFPIVDGREIMQIDKMNVDFTVGGMKIKLHNLFNGNKVLGITVNNFLNQNALEIISELSESIGDSLAAIFTDLMNKIYDRIPTDLWLIDEVIEAKDEITTTALGTTEVASTSKTEETETETSPSAQS